MIEFDDPLDLLDDDGDSVVEKSLSEKEEKSWKGHQNNNNGCCIIFLLLPSSLVVAGWHLSKFVL
jgi:hypothetical protein